MAEMLVKIDMADALAAVSKCLEPGSVLMTAEAVQQMADNLGLAMPQLRAQMLFAGGILAVQPERATMQKIAGGEETFSQETLHKNEAGAG